jgi:hypothetical protein
MIQAISGHQEEAAAFGHTKIGASQGQGRQCQGRTLRAARLTLREPYFERRPGTVKTVSGQDAIGNIHGKYLQNY